MGVHLKPSQVLACSVIVPQVLAVNALTSVQQVSRQHCLRNLEIIEVFPKSTLLALVTVSHVTPKGTSKSVRSSSRFARAAARGAGKLLTAADMTGQLFCSG